MSVATVKAHVSRLLVKLEVENRVQVALLSRPLARDRHERRRWLARVSGGVGERQQHVDLRVGLDPLAQRRRELERTVWPRRTG